MEGLDAMRVNLPTYKAQLAQVDAQIAAGVVSDELVGVQKQLKELVDLLESTAPVAAAETGDGDSEGAQRGVGTQSKEETGASSAPVETRKPQDGSSAAPNAALLEPGSRVEVSTEDGAPARAATIQSRTDLGVYTVKFIGKKAGLPAAADVGACESRVACPLLLPPPHLTALACFTTLNCTLLMHSRSAPTPLRRCLCIVVLSGQR